MEKWKDYDITLKKDELLFLDMIVKDVVARCDDLIGDWNDEKNSSQII